MNIQKIYCSGYGWLQLIIEEKTALVDCGMCMNEAEVLGGLKAQLGERPLDYVLLTHSHFDHVGCLSAIRRAYPGVQVVASAKTAQVFASEGARAFMQQMFNMIADGWKAGNMPRASRADGGLGEPDAVCCQELATAASSSSGNDTATITNIDSRFDVSGLFVDIVVKDGDEICLGSSRTCILTAIETKGHTDCSISFWCEAEKTLFASESIGVWFGRYPINLEICKNYRDVLASIAKQRSLGVKQLYISHSGLFEDGSPNEYFTMAEHCMIYYKDLVYTALADGKSDEEICALCKQKIYDVMLENGIQMDSFQRWLVNTKAFVANARRDLESNDISE